MKQVREISGGSGHMSQNSPLVEFGLGSATIVDELTVTWPSGFRTETLNVAVDQVVAISEPISTEVSQSLPQQFALYKNFPNPFNPLTTIKYELPRASKVVLQIFDLKGQLVKTLVRQPRLPAGQYEISWNGVNEQGAPMATGVYFYRLQADGFTDTRRMVLVK
jgi:hypothetical protein